MQPARFIGAASLALAFLAGVATVAPSASSASSTSVSQTVVTRSDATRLRSLAAIAGERVTIERSTVVVRTIDRPVPRLGEPVTVIGIRAAPVAEPLLWTRERGMAPVRTGGNAGPRILTRTDDGFVDVGPRRDYGGGPLIIHLD